MPKMSSKMLSQMYYTISVPPTVQKDIKEIHVVPLAMMPDFMKHYKIDAPDAAVILSLPEGIDPLRFHDYVANEALQRGMNVVALGSDFLQFYRAQERKKAGQEYLGVGVGVVVLCDDGEIPLTLRSGTSNNRIGEWELPGGTVEIGQSLEETVQREVLEEIGLEVLPQKCICVDEDFVEGQHWISFGYVARKIGGKLENKEPYKFADVRCFSPFALPDNTSSLTRNVVETFCGGQASIPIGKSIQSTKSIGEST